MTGRDVARESEAGWAGEREWQQAWLKTSASVYVCTCESLCELGFMHRAPNSHLMLLLWINSTPAPCTQTCQSHLYNTTLLALIRPWTHPSGWSCQKALLLNVKHTPVSEGCLSWGWTSPAGGVRLTCVQGRWTVQKPSILWCRPWELRCYVMAQHTQHMHRVIRLRLVFWVDFSRF